MKNMEINEESIKGTIIEVFKNYCEGSVSLENEIISLDIDSIDLVKIVIDLENIFGFEIDDELLVGDKLKISDYFNFICKKVNLK